MDCSRRGRPADNAKSESFDGPFRKACLNAHGFWSLENPRAKSRSGAGSAFARRTAASSFTTTTAPLQAVIGASHSLFCRSIVSARGGNLRRR
ncbi:transposase [Burkholderia multivorans]|uniref:integrase core domain-containing protein n=1 Tax=Burkholderia multivorans TaxID=87883 RepID=UPI001C24EBB8|nr:transposase [Burkholderia multivorans]